MEEIYDGDNPKPPIIVEPPRWLTLLLTVIVFLGLAVIAVLAIAWVIWHIVQGF